jgi:hypothetical protein
MFAQALNLAHTAAEKKDIVETIPYLSLVCLFIYFSFRNFFNKSDTENERKNVNFIRIYGILRTVTSTTNH